MLKSGSLRHVTSITSHDTQFIYLGTRIIGPPVVLRTIMGIFLCVFIERRVIYFGNHSILQPDLPTLL